VTDSVPARGIDHIGVTEPDIEAAARFLEAAFGATAIYDVQKPSGPPMAGEDVERQLGVPRRAEIVHISSTCG
jgi:catechol 2,3-dioxygenase-like lactoylglutathione lyase family enzyme